LTVRELDSLLIRAEININDSMLAGDAASYQHQYRPRPISMTPGRAQQMQQRRSSATVAEDNKKDAAARAYVRQTCIELGLASCAVR